MGGRRKSEPIQRSKISRLSVAIPYPTSVAETSHSDELEGIITAIQEKYKKRAREQRERAESAMSVMKEQMMQKVEEKITAYEEQINFKMERLKSDLQRNETERETQLVAMRVAYEDFKKQMHQMISDVEKHDSRFRRTVQLFFDEAAAFTKETKSAVKEHLAVVPSPEL